jgi:hypothetical protein
MNRCCCRNIEFSNWVFSKKKGLNWEKKIYKVVYFFDTNNTNKTNDGLPLRRYKGVGHLDQNSTVIRFYESTDQWNTRKILMRKSGAWILNKNKLYVKDLQISDFVWKMFKIQNFEYIVIFFDPELLNKSTNRSILRWNLLNKSFVSPFWVGICIGGTLRI